MPDRQTIAVISDLHYACAAERALGLTERRAIRNPLLAFLAFGFRHYLWMRHPLAQYRLLERFLAHAGNPDIVVANGDYSCDSSFVGVSDDVVCESVLECLTQLRSHFGARFYATIGDHELGKMSLFGGVGGPRLASWQRAQSVIGLAPFWHFTLGLYHFVGVTSTLLALPVYETEILPAERDQWREARLAHQRQIEDCFRQIPLDNKIVLFCHDPTALPFLKRLDSVRVRLPQVEQTWIGHLHSELVFWKSRMLAGLPTIRFLGNSVRRMSAALHEAAGWRDFRPRLSPALSGIELLKDGGYCRLRVDPAAQTPIQVERVYWRNPSRPQTRGRAGF